MPTVFTAAQRQAYESDGFVLIPSLFDAEENSSCAEPWSGPGTQAKPVRAP